MPRSIARSLVQAVHRYPMRFELLTQRCHGSSFVRAVISLTGVIAACAGSSGLPGVRPALLRLASARAVFALARTRSASARAASVASRSAIILATTSRFHASTSDLIEARCFSIEAALSLMNLAVEHA